MNDPLDPNFTAADMIRAVATRRWTRDQNPPWCTCAVDYGTDVICRACGLLLGPVRMRPKKLTVAEARV
jgi:hypothetical protein